MFVSSLLLFTFISNRKMKFTPIFLSIASAVVNAREFVDDLGVSHQTDKDKPTIVTFAHKAVTLARYGKIIMQYMNLVYLFLIILFTNAYHTYFAT